MPPVKLGYQTLTYTGSKVRHWHFDCSPRRVQGPQGCALEKQTKQPQTRELTRATNPEPIAFYFPPFALCVGRVVKFECVHPHNIVRGVK